MRSASRPLAASVGLLVLYLVWGSTYLGIKVAVGTVPPFIMGFLRFVPAGVILGAAVALRARGALPRPTLAQVRDAAIVGTMLLLGGTGLVSWSEQTIPSGIAALLIGLVPMWLAIFGRVLFGDRVPALAAVGIGVGLAGVAILAWPTGDVGRLDPAGLGVLLVAPMCWSLGTLYAAKRALLPAPALLSTAIQMVAAGLAFLVVALLTGETTGFDVASVSVASWSGIAYLVVMGSLVGYSTYAWLLTVLPLGRLATYAYVNPVVAVVLGWLVLGEPLSLRTIAAAGVIVAAVALIVTARGRADGASARRSAAPIPEAPAARSAPEPAPLP